MMIVPDDEIPGVGIDPLPGPRMIRVTLFDAVQFDFGSG